MHTLYFMNRYYIRLAMFFLEKCRYPNQEYMLSRRAACLREMKGLQICDEDQP